MVSKNIVGKRISFHLTYLVYDIDEVAKVGLYMNKNPVHYKYTAIRRNNSDSWSTIKKITHTYTYLSKIKPINLNRQEN